MARILPPKSDVLEFLSKENRPVHARELAQKFGVREQAFEGLVRLLDDLVFEGVLTAKPGQKFVLAKASRSSRGGGEEREGFLTIAARGFGFVASAAATGDDVYIPPEALKGGMQGDRVRISVRARGARGPEGEIIAILERAVKRVAGTLRRRGKSAWLEPDDARIRGPITLDSAVDSAATDGEGNSGKDGDAAVVSITRYPERPDENPMGKLEAVLGRPGELSVEVAKVLVSEQVEEVHSPEAFAEAESYGEQVPDSMLQGREDLTALPLPTIDPEDARDHDDAVWVERTPNGGYRAWIAIADVSSYVRPDTRLDAEARGRGCSIYLPDRAIPMLPRPLSSNLCSLLPGVIRLCLCAEVELDEQGAVKRTRLVRGFMNSRAKLTYGGVARALGLTEEPPRQPAAEDLIDGLRVAQELSRKLRARRMKRGAVDMDLPEAKFVLGEGGLPIDVTKRSQDPGVKKAYQLIEELMLLANEVVAEWLVARNVGTIFRVHARPDEQKLTRFAAMCESLGITFDAEDAQDPRKLSELVKSFADHPKAQVLSMLLLRSMKQAAYDVTNIGHFGLASKAYVHFTSPIRRYPDLMVHRGVHAVLLGQKTEKAGSESETLAQAALESSTRERKAMEVEREVADIYRCVFMRDKIGQRFTGTVNAFVGSGAYVALDSPFVDVLVRFEDMGGGERWELDDDGLRASSTGTGDVLQLGQTVGVEIIDVSLFRRTTLGRRVRLEGDAVVEGGGAARGRGRARERGKTGRGKPPQHGGGAAQRHDSSRGRSKSGAYGRARDGGANDNRPGTRVVARGDSGGGATSTAGSRPTGGGDRFARDRDVKRAITKKSRKVKPTKGRRR